MGVPANSLKVGVDVGEGVMVPVGEFVGVKVGVQLLIETSSM